MKHMNADELLEIVNQCGLLGKKAELDLRGLQVSSEPHATPASVRQALEAFAPTQGWLTFQSEVRRFLDGEPLPDAGVILYGEVRNAERALHIHQDGNGGWRLVYFRELSEGDYLAENTKLIAEAYASDPKNTRYDLIYRVYWGNADPLQEGDDGQGWRQIAAVFASFKKEKTS